jgi:hypothetical protein
MPVPCNEPAGTPAPLARGVACHTSGDDRAPRRPCLPRTTLSRHVEPYLSACWWKKNRPARHLRGRGDFSRSRVTACGLVRCYAHATALPRWLSPYRRSCPKMLPRWIVIPPTPDARPARFALPMFATGNPGSRGSRAHAGHVPGRACAAAGRAYVRWRARRCIILGPFGGVDPWPGRNVRRPAKTKREPRLDATGPRFSWSGAGRSLRAGGSTGPVNIGTRLPRRLSVTVGPGVVKGPF